MTHQTDNQGADFCYRNAGSQNRGDDGDLDLQPEVLALDESAAEAHLDYSTTWVPREENQDADDDSKIRDPGNYSVSADTFRWIEAHFGSHDVDLFADGDNHLLPRFVSRYCAEGAEAVDAFSVSWSQGVNWLHPPFSVLARVVGKLRDDRGRGTLLVPRFPSASWWPALFPRRGHQPVLRQLTIPAGRHTFVAHEPAAALGHGDFPPATMIALQVDFAAA
ncbi:MAG: DNA N-6-adenine-methyltransferase [Pseudomonadota bacterium]